MLEPGQVAADLHSGVPHVVIHLGGVALNVVENVFGYRPGPRTQLVNLEGGRRPADHVV